MLLIIIHIFTTTYHRQFVKADAFPSCLSCTCFISIFPGGSLPLSVESTPYQHPHDSIGARAYFSRYDSPSFTFACLVPEVFDNQSILIYAFCFMKFTGSDLDEA